MTSNVANTQRAQKRLMLKALPSQVIRNDILHSFGYGLYPNSPFCCSKSSCTLERIVRTRSQQTNGQSGRNGKIQRHGLWGRKSALRKLLSGDCWNLPRGVCGNLTTKMVCQGRRPAHQTSRFKSSEDSEKVRGCVSEILRGGSLRELDGSNS